MHDIVTLDENDQVSGVLMNDAMMDDRMARLQREALPDACRHLRNHGREARRAALLHRGV